MQPKIYNLGEIQAKQIPDRIFYLKPLIFPGSMTMLYAAPGVGKTFVTLWLAAACAGQGTFLKWKSETKGRVLYIDGEMGIEEAKIRLGQLAVGIDYPLISGDFHFITPDESNMGEIPLISDFNSHKFYLEAAKNRDVIIFDNYGCLTEEGKDTDSQVWVKAWKLIKQLRAQGKAIVIIHHAGKGGSQLGSSRKEQPLNWLIELKRPAIYDPKDGAKFELSFKKMRGIYGADLESMSICLKEEGQGIRWEWQNLNSDLDERIHEMKDVGMTPQQIATSLNLSVFHILKTLSSNTITLKDKGDNYYYSDEDKF